MGMSCGPSGDICVFDDLLEACSSLADGAPCTVLGLPPDKCVHGVCQASRCGDGRVTGTEACDGAQLGGKTCLDFGDVNPEGLRCTAACSFDVTGCSGYCGDGIKQSSEECDGTQFGGATCITEGFYGGTILCTTDCKISLASCSGRCGDGIQQFSEDCDGNDLGGATCASRGFLGPAVQPLLCTSACSFDPSSCTCGGILCAQNTQQCVLVDNHPTCSP